MVERALRGVVRDALTRVAQEGPRGAHHFYIGFATQMPGVVLPESLRSKYPDEMTIVLQHQFWDLEVGGPPVDPAIVGTLPAPATAEPETPTESDRPAAEVVTLDSFRKR